MRTMRAVQLQMTILTHHIMKKPLLGMKLRKDSESALGLGIRSAMTISSKVEKLLKQMPVFTLMILTQTHTIYKLLATTPWMPFPR
uniref:Alternative protein SLC12A1 n=1 Tax=Homo sapiens TaxID=9606 RepID=L8E9E3_HUMAN|nr:alternative protein SLC12A1 [Homo sapiens]